MVDGVAAAAVAGEVAEAAAGAAAREAAGEAAGAAAAAAAMAQGGAPAKKEKSTRKGGSSGKAPRGSKGQVGALNRNQLHDSRTGDKQS